MSELPERIWAPSVDILALEVFASLARKKANSGQAYLRADTAIPKAEAEAMVAAVVESCGEVLEECGIDGSAFAQTFEEYRTGRAALDKIVQEAVEAERERCARIAEPKHKPRKSDAEVVASARLIVAAPEMAEALIDVTASLVAAISLLERGGKKAAASDKMFEQMLVDYHGSVKRSRAVLAKARGEQ